MPDGDADSAGGWVLTASDALARELRERVNAQNALNAVGVWEAPRIQSLSRWCIEQWSASWPKEQLLGATQEWLLWQQAIERQGPALLAPQSAARQARAADQLLRRYCVDGRWSAWAPEHQAFRRWQQVVAARCQAMDWLTSADIAARVAELIDNGRIGLPASVELRGFVNPPEPAEQRVLEALRAKGVALRVAAPEAIKPHQAFHRFADDRQMLRFVAQRLRQLLPSADDGQAPRILIVLPEVESRRQALEVTLRRLVAPWMADGERTAPWRWLQGESLSEQPQVDLMLDLLQLQAEGNPPDRISRLLLSAQLWDAGQRQQTATLDAWLRRQGPPRIRLSALCERLSGVARTRLSALLDQIKQAPRRALPSAWAGHFSRRLSALQWPAAPRLDSVAYQATSGARELLDRLATVDAQLGEVPPQTALSVLRELATSVPFAARADHLQPVRIASLEEAASLSADVLLLLDAGAVQLLPPARPNPWVPLDVLRGAGVPQASPASWLQRRQRQVDALLNHCAPQVELCYAQVDAQGAQVLPSPLLGDAAQWQACSVADRIGALEQALQDEHSICEPPDDDPVPAVTQAEKDQLRAGSSLYKAWFEAPFFAFAQTRLGIRPLAEPARGISAVLQGQLLHDVLYDFWGQVPDRAALQAMHASQRAAVLEPLIDKRLRQYLPVPDYGDVAVQLERLRLRRMITQWLAHETERVDAFVVHARECQAHPVVAGLSLSLRLDRVDRVDTPVGTRWLVLDYKTGSQVQPGGWRADRLSEPQLPLYASHAVPSMADIARVDGIGFAHLKEGHPCLSTQTNWRPKLCQERLADQPEEWARDVAQWQAAIEHATVQFLAGFAPAPQTVSLMSPNAPLMSLINAPLTEE